jgi:long-chain acyl-CoA synthetase
MSPTNATLLVHQFLEHSAETFPDKTALVFKGERLTYAEFERAANALAHGLIERGVKRGDRVIVWHANSVETCVSIFAILKAGAAFVVINPTTKGEKLLRLVEDCRPSALITDGRHLRQVEQSLWALAPEVQVIVVGEQTWPGPNVSLYTQFLSDLPTSRPGVRCIDRDLAALIYTSGSTGVPKGVMSAHYNIVAAASAITQYVENVPEDIIIDVLPLSFDYGLYQLLMSVLIGGTLVLESSFAFPLDILSLMRQECVTGLPGVPSLFALILQLAPEQLSLPDLRYITNTGAALPVSHINRLREIFGSAVRIYSMYGQTECKRTLYLPPEELDRRPGSVGIPIPNEEVFVVDEDGNEVPPGQVGELVVRGANVMLGYWGHPEESARTFPPGPLPGERVLRSGDLFYRDEDGFLYFVARRDDIIKVRGQKVSPKEVEAALFQLEGIADAAVVGVEHPVWGQTIQAHVVLRDGADLDDKAIIRCCRQMLEDFMVPDEVIFHDALPKNDSGKTDRSSLVRPA